MAVPKTITKLKRLLSPGSLTTLGFGVILAGFSAAPAQALTANSGTDYLLTPTGGAKFVFDPPPAGGGTFIMPFSGLPIRSFPMGGYVGQADTVVNRFVNVIATPAGGITDIEVVGLSLFAKNVPLPSPFGGPYDTVAGLQKYYGNTAGGGPTSVGTMTIRGDLAGNPTTWDSNFTVKAIAFFAAPGSLGLPDNPYAGTHSPDLVNNIIGGIKTAIPGDTSIPYACESGAIPGVCLLFNKEFNTDNQPWSTTPYPNSLLGPNLVPGGGPTNFFVNGIDGLIPHDAGNGTIHSVTTFGVLEGNDQPPLPFPPGGDGELINISSVPGPLPILGLGAALTASRRIKKIYRQA